MELYKLEGGITMDNWIQYLNVKMEQVIEKEEHDRLIRIKKRIK